ncbi:hypothetical protein KM914_14120 [Virgibacillus pantothenticus]|uniref:hypothetical protein n=1 Tax=Virgibacillus pantothenticus TaxID=1473 RepID=UPI001C21DB40|nr:hypothetical protein [Virgibacillus pantothenticus]MBU8567558.1 hypothetical protein [Virgibacillus pantothenticus]MBU8601346.1 hypothetical protein [Virgibacillus pantothenticus]MBU8636163.1 hypothetical protein [Virgibacillus pantothenticus]MBU8643683.1 hypothetical protein [Virgibacillus pantothenticus]MBU8648061.1 hypothetical protein [Virgibacillus pantothenticus]
MKEPYRIYNDIEACIQEVNKFQLKDIIINEVFYSGRSIRFLDRIPTVESVHITSDKIDDFSSLYEMPNLKKLIIDATLKKSLDLNFLDLEELSINWSKKVIGLSSLVNLKKISLSSYSPLRKDLKELENMKNLEKLELIKGNIESLKGLRKVNNLKELSLFDLKYLRSLSSSENKSDRMTDIEIQGCHKISDMKYVSCYKNLRSLIISKMGKIPSLQFVTRMKHLEHFVILDTEIEDGDLTPCLGIDYVRFDEKNWYSHSNATFKKANGLAKKQKRTSH